MLISSVLNAIKRPSRTCDHPEPVIDISQNISHFETLLCWALYICWSYKSIKQALEVMVIKPLTAQTQKGKQFTWTGFMSINMCIQTKIGLISRFTLFAPKSCWLSTLHNLTQCASSIQSCSTLCYLMVYSPPGFSIHGIFQARILEWVAILFSTHLLN